ncbi:MAG: acyl-CoA synthetase [Pseudomonadota bacterium]
MRDKNGYSILEKSTQTFDQIYQSFQWDVPDHFNMAHAVCDKHASIGDSIALYYENENGEREQYTFTQIKRYSDKFANVLKSKGVEKGDRVALILSQRVETAIVHIAAHKLGAISLPLSVLFGPDALQYRLKDSGSKIVVTDTAHVQQIEGFNNLLPDLQETISIDSANQFWSLLESAEEQITPADTLADDPALLIYTSGTTGPPKGALIAHRGLIGNLTGFEMSMNFFPRDDDVFWTPADWAWTGGLLDGLMPSWFYGKPIVAYENTRFNAENALDLMQRYQVTTAFIPPTALKMMRKVENIENRYSLKLRAIVSAGEAVGEELVHWAREHLKVDINEMCGQTEHNYMIGNCSAVMPLKPGSMGKAYPGHRVTVLDEQGNQLGNNETGEFAAHKSDPVHFLGYWNNPAATAKKYAGDWFKTGDVGYRDDDGYLWFMGRSDDVISSAGYRIGPGEIEDCLMQHPAVLQAAAVGVPDPEGVRGDIVKAYIVLAKGHEASDTLKSEIQKTVRSRLAAYEYPRAIEFIDTLPMTTTGKVRRIELRQRDLNKNEV